MTQQQLDLDAVARAIRDANHSTRDGALGRKHPPTAGNPLSVGRPGR